MPESDILLLWIIIASNDCYGELLGVYATNEAHARALAAPWLAQRAHLLNVEARAYPDGFTITSRFLPGTISAHNGTAGKPQPYQE